MQNKSVNNQGRTLQFFLVILILSLSFFLRIHNLPSVPPILAEKELRIGLASLNSSVNIQDIGSLSILATTPFVKIFGLSAFSVRLPSVIFATFSTIIFFFIMKKKFNTIYFLSFLFLSFSPYFIQMSRIDTGINLGLCFFLLSIYFSLYIPKHPKMIFFMIVSFALSIYADYSFFIPSIGAYILVIIFARKILSKNLIASGVSVLCFILLITPVLSKSINYITHVDDTKEYLLLHNKQISNDRISYSMNTRLSKILYNADIENIKLNLKNITQYLEPHQLFFTWTYNPNYTTSDSGLFYPFDLLFFIAGTIYLIKKDRALLCGFAIWTALAILSVSLTKNSPDLTRIIFLIPQLIVINSLGFFYIIKKVNRKAKFIFVSCVGLIASYFLLRFIHIYFTKYPENFIDYQPGYEKALLYQKNNFPKANVVLTDVTFGKNIYLYSLFLDKSKATPNLSKIRNNSTGIITSYGNYTFLSQTPTQYNSSNIYIQPAETIPQNIKLFFTNLSNEKKFEISVFSTR